MLDRMSDVELSLVVPVYQEETVIPKFLARVVPVLEKASRSFEIIFCLDPGKDNTRGVIEEAIRQDSRIRLLYFSRRFGQPACTIAGIEHARGQACVVIDVDLQDPPEVIPEFVLKWREGYDVVYAKRRKREGETLPKRLVSYLAYRVMNKLADVPIPKDTGDFRLISRRVIEELRRLKETHGFLRGLVAYVGFRQTEVLYDREARVDGRSKYSQITGSLRIGINGLVTNSTKPLTFFLLTGLFATITALISSVIVLGLGLTLGFGLGAVTALIVSINALFASVILFALGVMGEYVGRIYDEARMRPKYILSEEINAETLSQNIPLFGKGASH